MVTSSVYFDADLKVIYEVPPESSFIIDNNGYRIYIPNYITNENIETIISVQKDIWSRGQDFWSEGNDWSDFPLLKYGKNFQAFDEENNLLRIQYNYILKVSEGWKIVLADYQHTCTIVGNIYSDINETMFDNSRLSNIVSINLEYTNSNSFLTNEEHEKLMTLPDLTEIISGIWDYENIINKISMLYNISVGDWEIRNNQMIFYDSDNNEILKFDLKNKKGKPSDLEVFSRIKV